MQAAIVVAPAAAESYRAIELYYRLRGFTPLRQQRNAVPHMTRYLEWCREHEVDHEAFMRFRLEQVPDKRVGIASLRSIKSLEAFREWGEGRALADQWYEKAKVDMLSPHEDRVQALAYEPTRAQEILRGDYVARDMQALCIVEHRYTGGYDPRSKVCPTCPSKHHCLKSLNGVYGFDVGALRAGMFHRLPAPIAKIVRKNRR